MRSIDVTLVNKRRWFFPSESIESSVYERRETKSYQKKHILPKNIYISKYIRVKDKTQTSKMIDFINVIIIERVSQFQ